MFFGVVVVGLFRFAGVPLLERGEEYDGENQLEHSDGEVCRSPDSAAEEDGAEDSGACANADAPERVQPVHVSGGEIFRDEAVHAAVNGAATEAKG